MRFAPVTLTKDEEALRLEVRTFLAEELPEGTYRPSLGVYASHSPEFSKRLADRGWVGMAVPAQYGGQGRSPVDRFIVVEELLAAGAPVGAHWIADRQTAQTLLVFGTEMQRQWFLPAISAGECFFSIGMSEPDAGSDLASVRTTAHKVSGGWSLSGTKIWTSNAHLNHFFVVLCRTSPLEQDRHHGLSQLIVDLTSPGLTIRPVRFLDGQHHFNEVMLDGVFVPDEMVLGEVGMGWTQVTSELSYERSGPDRYLSSAQLLKSFLAERGTAANDAAEELGRLAARLWAIRQLSLSVARKLQLGRAPALEAAIVKDLGTIFEQETVAVMQTLLGVDPNPSSSSLFESLLAQATLISPSYTIRGGTTEVLRSVAARGLIPWSAGAGQPEALLEETLSRVLSEQSDFQCRQSAETSGWAKACWDALAKLGLPWISVPESVGGSGGEPSDGWMLVRMAGRYAVPLPLAECSVLGGWLLASAGLHVPLEPLTVAIPRAQDGLVLEDGKVSGQLAWVPWASHSLVVATVTAPQGTHVVLIDPAGATLERGHSLAGEERDSLRFEAVSPISCSAGPVSPAVVDLLELRGALSRTLLMAGAMEAIAEMTVTYAANRVQFGRSVASFQAVAHRLVQLTSEAEAAALAAQVAADRFADVGTDAFFEVAAARATASRSASIVATHAHQVHGAIGMTQEYPLHHFTRRLWAWRNEWGTERQWSGSLGREVVARGPQIL